MPRPISYAVFCLKKKNTIIRRLSVHPKCVFSLSLIFLYDTSTTEIYTLSLHDALPISAEGRKANDSHADCYQYFCVPEYGTANGRLHFHAVHFMRTLPTGSSRRVNRSEERFSRNAETDLVCRLLLEKKKHDHQTPISAS